MRKNPDYDLRLLERAAEEGDTNALNKLTNEADRRKDRELAWHCLQIAEKIKSRLYQEFRAARQSLSLESVLRQEDEIREIAGRAYKVYSDGRCNVCDREIHQLYEGMCQSCAKDQDDRRQSAEEYANRPNPDGKASGPEQLLETLRMLKEENILITYHGTTKALAEKILTEGFKRPNLFKILQEGYALTGLTRDYRRTLPPWALEHIVTDIQPRILQNYFQISSAPHGVASRWAGWGGEVLHELVAKIETIKAFMESPYPKTETGFDDWYDTLSKRSFYRQLGEPIVLKMYVRLTPKMAGRIIHEIEAILEDESDLEKAWRIWNFSYRDDRISDPSTIIKIEVARPPETEPKRATARPNPIDATFFHGSPYSSGNIMDFANFELAGGILFLSPCQNVAQEYTKVLLGSGRKPKQHHLEKPTVYTVKLGIEADEIFDTRKPEHHEMYKKLRRHIASLDPEDNLGNLARTPALQDCNLQIAGDFPSFGAAHMLKSHLMPLGFRGVWISEGSQGASLALFNPLDAKILATTSSGSRRNPAPVLWEPEKIARLKQTIREEFGSHPIAHSLWGDEPYGWIDNPQSDQDLVYNKILYDWEGGAFHPQVRVPATEWLIHYTRADFTRFNRARRFQDNLKENQFAGGHNSYMVQLDCQKPLSEIPYGFQFAWSTSHMIYERYYADTIWQKKMKLFRSDSAVQHAGDNGEVVFRACSEKDLMSFTYKGQGRGDNRSGVWVSDETGESLESPLKLVQWADARVGIQRRWPLPIPGFFTSVEEVRIWAERIRLCGWQGMLKRQLDSDLPQLETLPPEEAVKFFNQNYYGFSFLQGK